MPKLSEAIELMNQQRVHFLIELGDFKDENRPATETRTVGYLRAIEDKFRQFKGPTYHVLGNHDLDSLSKAEFMANIANTGVNPRDRTYYSFDANGIHFVALDANFSANDDRSGYDHTHEVNQTYLPPSELSWLEADLAAAANPAIVFVHQLLDGKDWMHVRNSAEVRRVLEASGKVLACFQGHHHPGAYHQIAEIHYYTLKAMVEGSGDLNNAYATVTVDRHYNLVVTGYRKALSQDCARPHPAAF